MRWFKALLGFAAAVLMSSAAAAQTTTGTISGRIVDSQGLALPGVTVTVAGPNLQGTLTVVSTDNGDYTIPRVPPGTYTVTFELSGFQRQEKPATIALSQALTLNTALGPASLTETVDVRPGDGEILTHTAAVATNFKQELMATLPTTRDINAVVLKAPGVHPSGPNGSYSIAGSMSFESLYLVNGVNVNENLRGQANNLYIEDAVQETMVATDGISAEYGRFSGGVVNVVTKSGGNRFSGSFRDSLFNDDWRAKVTGNDDHPFLTDTKVDRVISQYQYVLGGPIVRDSLWFFTAGRIRNAPVGRNTVTPLNIPYTFEDKSQRYEGKMTYSLTGNHRFDGTYTKVNQTEANGTFSTATSMDLRSLYTRELPQNLFTVGYSGVITPSLFVEGRYSARHFSFIGSGATSTDLIDGTLLIDSARGNLRYWSPTFCGVCDPEKRDNEEVFLKGDLCAVEPWQRIAHGALRLRHVQRQAFRQQPPVRQRLPHPRHVLDRPWDRHLSALAAGLDDDSVESDRDRHRGHELPHQRHLPERHLALDRSCDRQRRPSLGQEPGAGQRRAHGRGRQRVQPAARRRVGSGRQWALGDLGQLFQVRRRSEQFDRRFFLGGRQPGNDSVRLQRSGDQSGHRRGVARHARRRAPAAVRVVQRQWRHEHDADVIVCTWRIGADSKLADVAECAGVCGRPQPAARRPRRRARRLLVSRLPRLLLVAHRSLDGHRHGSVRQPRRSCHPREYERSQAPILGRHDLGPLPDQFAERRWRKLHAIAAVGQFRRRELGQRTADERPLPVSGVSARRGGSRRKATSPPISGIARSCG